jgi:hypothetical protein
VHVLARHAECALHVARQCVAAVAATAIDRMRLTCDGCVRVRWPPFVVGRARVRVCERVRMRGIVPERVLVCLCMAAVDCVQAL